MDRTQTYPIFLAVALAGLMLWSFIEPAFMDVWIAEMIPVIAVYLGLLLGYRYFRFSHVAYSLMAIWLAMHTIGAHYTFANVPFDFVSDLFGFERNHFDRIAHFSIGFYAYPMVEWLMKKQLASLPIAVMFSLFFIMSLAACYELIEWQYAVIEGGEAGIEFLGSQGDIWDAQKDILADTLGAIASLGLFLLLRTDRSTAVVE